MEVMNSQLKICVVLFDIHRHLLKNPYLQEAVKDLCTEQNDWLADKFEFAREPFPDSSSERLREYKHHSEEMTEFQDKEIDRILRGDAYESDEERERVDYLTPPLQNTDPQTPQSEEEIDSENKLDRKQEDDQFPSECESDEDEYDQEVRKFKNNKQSDELQ